MNQKLHNTILASAVVGAALLFGLLAAQPVEANRPSARQAYHHAGYAAGKLIAAELRHELARDVEARTRGLEAELAGASAGEAVALASALLASSVVEATVTSVLEEVTGRQPPVRRRAQPRSEEQPAGARDRGALAMPYFSTAHGLRRGGGE